MVVRSVVGYFVYKLPFSNHLPEFIDRIFLENENKTHNTSEIASEIPLNDPIRNAKKNIHERIMLNRRNKKDRNVSDIDTLKLSSINEQDFDKSTLVNTWDDNDETLNRDARMKQYLLEQNNKFNELINSNLENFLKQEKFCEKDANRISVVELIKNSSITYLNYLNFLSNMSKSFHYISNKDHNNINNRFNIVSKKHFNDSNIETNDDKSNNATEANNGNNIYLIPLNDKELLSLKDTSELDHFITSLSDKDKILLWHKLNEDIRKEREISKEGISSNESLNKIQSLLIILIKLFFSIMKRIIPILHFVYIKYSNDELLLLNKKNFNVLLTHLIEFLNYMDYLLNSEEKEISNTFDKYFLKSPGQKNIYNAFSFSSIADMTPKDDSWSSMAMRYILTKYLDQGNERKHTEGYYLSSDINFTESTESITSENSQTISLLNAAEQFAKEMT